MIVFLTAFMGIAQAECENWGLIESSVSGVLNPGDTVDLAIGDYDCSSAVPEDCTWEIDGNRSGILSETDGPETTYSAPQDVECGLTVTIYSSCPSLDNTDVINSSVEFTVNTEDPCKISGGGCQSGNYAFLILLPFMLRGNRRKFN